MIPAPFEYRCPQSTRELLVLLSKYRESCRILAGGQGLLPALRKRTVRPSMLLDLRRIPGLVEVEPDGEGIRIGALVTYRRLETSPLVQARCPALAEVAGRVGDIQVRNLGTLAGSVCEGDPAADAPALLVALDAEVEILSPRGNKMARVGDFLQGATETALEPDEFVRALRVPSASSLRGVYLRRPLCARGFALAGVAALLLLEEGRALDVRVAVTGVARRVFRAKNLERDLVGKELDAELVHAVARDICRGEQVLSDAGASARYRSHLADVLAARALLRAAGDNPG